MHRAQCTGPTMCVVAHGALQGRTGAVQAQEQGEDMRGNRQLQWEQGKCRHVASAFDTNGLLKSSRQQESEPTRHAPST